MPINNVSTSGRGLVIAKDVIEATNDNDPLVERIVFSRRVLAQDIFGNVTTQSEAEDSQPSQNIPTEDTVELLVNPQNISVVRRKVVQKQMTNSGWVYHQWGHEPLTLRYNGVTGYMQPQINSEIIRKPPEDNANASLSQVVRHSHPTNRYTTLYDTPAYRSLAALKRFYEEPNLLQLDPSSASSQDVSETVAKTLIEMEFRNEIFVGYFISFEIREEEMSPWSWSYSMEFLADKVEGGISPSFDGVDRNYQFISDDPMRKGLRGLYADDGLLPDAEVASDDTISSILEGVVS